MTSPFLAVGPIGMPEMIMILAILLLLFGGSKLPALAKGLGQSVKEFKKATKEGDDEPAAKPVVESKKVEPANPARTTGAN